MTARSPRSIIHVRVRRHYRHALRVAIDREQRVAQKGEAEEEDMRRCVHLCECYRLGAAATLPVWWIEPWLSFTQPLYSVLNIDL